MRLRLFLFAAVIVTGTAFAQDPPSRVARLNWINGNVSFQPAGIDTWTEASLNYPLTTGDHLYTDTGSRAEMHIGANALRLEQQSNFGFLNLDDRLAQVRFTGGSLEIRVRRLDDDDVYEIDTPQGAISLLRTGDYRIDTDPDRNATMLTVRGGEAIVSSNGSSFPVHARQTVYFADGAEPDIRDANPLDDFDRFTQARNAREDRVPPPVHVDPDMAGYEDLDANGSWSEDPGYGWVWAPRVEAGWAPYRHGRWAWVEPWGWTWIDEAPWGFAPFHYGRWAYLQASWVWVPGAVVRRPVYAPALVAFVRTPGFSIGIGIGGGVGAVAWFPLGPREPYYPSYHVSNTYVRQVNITHVTNINVTNINNVTNVRYVNQQVPGAVTAVPQNTFTGSRSVAQVARPVSAAQMAQARVVGTAPAVAPERQSVMANARVNGPVAQPPQAMMNRQVVARATPPPAPVRFEAKQDMLTQSQGRPLAPDQLTQIRQQQPAAVVSRAPVRAASVPAPVSAPAPAIQNNRPVFQPRGIQPQDTATPPPNIPAPNRMDSRPPNARPQPVPAAQPQAPAYQAPAYQPPPQRPTPQFAPRPVPENRPAPVESRPVPQAAPRAVPPETRAPEARPEPARPAPAPRAEPAGRPEPARPAPAKEATKEDTKDEVKPQRGR